MVPTLGDDATARVGHDAAAGQASNPQGLERELEASPDRKVGRRECVVRGLQVHIDSSVTRAGYLERSNAEFMTWLEEGMTEVDDPRANLVAAFEATGKLATNPRCLGCTFQGAASEFPEIDHPGHQVALAHKQAVRERFAGLAREAGLRDPDGLAAQLLLLMDGAWVAARRFGPDNHAASWPTQPGSSSTPTLRRRPETGWANSVALETDLARRAVCAIETTGRRSGLPRLIEIWFAADPERDRIYRLSGGRDRAHWVRNLRRNPAVRVRIDGRWYAGVATEIEGDQDDGLARRLLAAKYQGWAEGGALSDWARNSLPLAIDLRADAAMTSPPHDRGAVSQ